MMVIGFETVSEYMHAQYIIDMTQRTQYNNSYVCYKFFESVSQIIPLCNVKKQIMCSARKQSTT